MTKYFINVDVINVNGTQTWEINASSPEEACEKLKRGEGDIIAEELDVMDTDINQAKPEDFYEG